MIEATCTACGTVNRMTDADVPVGAKFVNCASCKSRVALPAKAAATMPAGPSTIADFADLPAPRPRNSALAGDAAKPAPRSGLAAAEPEMPAELPAPRSGAPKKPAAGPLDLDELLAPPDGGADLPAPRPGQQKNVTDLPAPRSAVPARPGGGRAMTDLPVPGVADTSPLADLPSPKPKGAAGLADLPAPRPKMPVPAVPKLPTPPAKAPPLADLPAPKAKSGLADVPPKSSLADTAVGAPPPLADLPAPKLGAPKPLADLPAPKPGGPKPLADLPSPKAKQPGVVDLPMPKAQQPGVVDLPTPKAGLSDLPTPKGVTDLLTPKPGGAGDLPAPKGFFEDLPQSAGAQRQNAGTDVAPKGFFDDLPQSAGADRQPQPTDDVAPKGFFDDLPGRTTKAPGTDVAPKGFFEDLPGRPSGPAKPEVPAPKGFFDDLPGKPAGPAKPEVPAPKGFFDDLPGKPSGPRADGVAPKAGGFFDDLPKPEPAQGGDELALDSLDLDPSEGSQPGIELDLDDAPARAKAPSVAPAPGPSNQFDDLDLSAPSPVSFTKKAPGPMPGPMPGGVATITPSAAAAAAAVAKPALPPIGKGLGGPGADAALELEEPRTSAATPKLGTRVEAKPKKPAAGKKEPNPRARKIAGIAMLGVLALGGGGYYMYQRHAKAQAHENAVNEQLTAARRAIATSNWQRASTTANATLDLDKTNAEALGIRAEALFALGIVEGGNQGRFGQARKMIAAALEANKQHPAIERAKALSPLAANQPDKAIPALSALVKAAPKDSSLQLYLAWAYASLGDSDNAIKSFDVAAGNPAVKVHALFGRARAKQAKGDLEGARADYTAVLDAQKDHIGAQVGLASTLPAAQGQQQEADLLAILALKDVEKREPRAAMQAWMLAAESAKRGGRLDVARERFRKALAIQAADVEALTGLAEVELRDGKLDVASAEITKALQASPQDVRAQLVAAEIAIAQKKYPDAQTKLDALAKRTPPPPVVEQARMKSLEARLFEAQGKEQNAIEAYLEAAKLAGELDLTPTLTAASKLTEFSEKAAAANDVARASELRKLAEGLLENLSSAALKDPNLALTLGMAYMQANDPAKAENWLRKAIEMSPKNVDALYQLAKAQSRQGKDTEAIVNLRTAVELDPTRTEIGIELARTYEDAKRDVDAEKLYDKLLNAKEPALELRTRAGRFFAKIGRMDKAGEQGERILEVQEGNPAGLYLKGEGLLVSGKTDPARKLFVMASDADPEAQYLDARGRAAEKWADESGNTTYQDDALNAYRKATEKDPTMFTSWVGQGRLYVARKEDIKAVPPLQKAWDIKQTAEVARLLGIAAKNLNEAKTATQWLEKSLALEENALASYNLGVLYTNERVNNPRGAISAFERAVRLAEADEKKTGKAPEWYLEALYQLGDIRRTENDLRGAKAAWEKWLGRNPPNNARYKEVQTQMATTLRSVP